MTPLLERLQGEWTPVTIVTNGQPLADAMLAYGSRTMSGNETKVVFGGQTMVHAKMRLDESTTPVAVDYLNVGRGAMLVTLGIIEWIGDEVRFPRSSQSRCRLSTERDAHSGEPGALD